MSLTSWLKTGLSRPTTPSWLTNPKQRVTDREAVITQAANSTLNMSLHIDDILYSRFIFIRAHVLYRLRYTLLLILHRAVGRGP